MDVIDPDVSPGARPLPYGLATLATLLLWAYALAVVVSSFAAPVGVFDDALVLVHGALVQGGRTPSVDFWSFYPGGIHYLNAAAFSLFGKTVIAVRLAGGILLGFVVFGTVRVLDRLLPELRSLVPLHALILGATVATVITSPAWPGYAVALLAFLTYLSAVPHLGDYRLRLGASGVLTGLAIMCRVNFGGYAAFVAIVDLVLGWWLLGHSRWEPRHVRQHMAYVGVFVIATLATFAAVATAIYGGSVAVALSQFVVGAARVMATRGFIDLETSARLVLLILFPCGWVCLRMLVGRDEVPPKAMIPACFGMLILVAALIFRHDRSVVWIVVCLELVSVLTLHLSVQRLERAELCIVLFSSVSLHYFLSRADQYHWRFLLTGPALLLPYLLFRGLHGEARQRPPLQTGTAVAVVLSVLCAFSVAPRFRPRPSQILNGAELMLSVARHPRLSDSERVLGAEGDDSAWKLVYEDENERKLLSYLRTATNRFDPIFVGVKDQSRVFFNNLRIYWLADRPIGVRAFQLETQVATEAAVQREQIGDLEQNRVNWLVLDGLQTTGDLAFWRRGYQGSTDFDEYVSTHYVEVARFGRFSVLRNAMVRPVAATGGESAPGGLSLARSIR